MATDVREFIEQRTLRRVMVLGHSTGGKVAMQFDIDYSEQVDRLIVADIAPKAYELSLEGPAIAGSITLDGTL